MTSGFPNQGQLRPLTAHGLSELRRIAEKPVPQQDVNAGVYDRLSRESLVRVVQLPSPYAIHKGKNINHLEITDAGRAKLATSANLTVIR